MRILFCTGSPARYMAPPILADEQINCGPDWMDRDIGGHVLSLHSPLGEYDIGSILARLPNDQQPDAVVCLVDSSWRSAPRNLKALRCPKVLLVADTHHLSTPISGMVRYARSESFDRIVLLYDRHHWEFFNAGGLRNLFWFPGLTFPHSDQAIAAARSVASRAAEIAFVGQTGGCHPRRSQLLSQLLANHVPVAIESVGQRESLALYGRSLVGFNASLNGDLNLRAFEVMAGGAMLLTDRLGEQSGLNEIWTEGRELLTYASTGEMIEKAKHALAHSDEARTIGAAGAQWFDRHFNETSRKAAFQKLMTDGVPHPAFSLPQPTTISMGCVAENTQARLTVAYEYLQELHRNLDRVAVAADESVPESFVRLCATLPRVNLQRGLPAKGSRLDFLVIGRNNFQSPTLAAAAHVCPWDWIEADRVALVRRCTSMGFSLVEGAGLFFSRQKGRAPVNGGVLALARLEQGNYAEALKLAKAELAKNFKSIEALVVLCEIAQESGNVENTQLVAAQLRSFAPHHPRVHQTFKATGESGVQRRPSRLLRMAFAYLDHGMWSEVARLTQEALALVPTSAEAHYLIGLCSAADNKPDEARAALGLATQLDAENGEYWYELGSVLRTQGRSPDAVGALQQATILEPDNFIFQLALGEAALSAGDASIAEQALSAARRLRPDHAAAVRWSRQVDVLASQLMTP